MEHRIRLRYSTITNYSSMIYRMIVAVGFAIIVARRLDVEEYGLWGIILSASLMLSTPVVLWSTWAPRFIARGWKEAGMTGLILTLGYWLPGGLVYLLVSLIEEKILGWGFNFMLLGLPLMMLETLDAYLGSLITVVKPELRGYKNFVYETFRIVLVYIALVSFGFKLDGVIFSVELALFFSVSYVGYKLYKMGVFTRRFSVNLARSWLKVWYLPSFSLLIGFLRSGLRAVVSWVTGSEVPVAYLNVGFSAEAPLIQASGAGTSALYAKSLRARKGEDLEETLRLFLFFIGYMFPVFFVLSKVIATLYNPIYVEASVVVSTVSVYAVLMGLAGIYATVLSGIETVDIKGIPSHKLLLSSYLFKVPFTRLLGTIFSYLIFIPLLYYYRTNPLIGAEVVAVSLLITTIPLLYYYAEKAGVEVSYRFPVRETIAVSIAATISSLYYIAMGVSNIVVAHFWIQIPAVVFHLTVGLIIYLVLMYLINPWARKLYKDALAFIGVIKNS